VSGSVGMTFKPVEYFILDVRGNARTAIGDGKDDAMLAPPGTQADDGIVRRETDGVSQQVIKDLHDAPFVADKPADVRFDIDFELDAVGCEPVLHTLGGGIDCL